MQARLTQGAVGSAAIAAALYLGFSNFAGWRGVVSAFAEVGGLFVAAALALSLVNYGLRIARWRLYLAALGFEIDWESAEAVYLAGFAFTATPGKAGELLRGVFLQRRGVPFLTATAAFVSERVGDLVAMLVIALPGAAACPNGGPIFAIAFAVLAALVVALSQAHGLERARAALERTRLPFAARLSAPIRLLIESRRCHAPRIFALGLGLGLVAWSAEAFAFDLVLGRMGVEIGLGAAMSIYALSMLAGAISFLPGGVGGAEAVMTALLILAGAGEAEAVAATIVIRLATLWYAVAIGAAALAIERRRLFQPASAP